MMPGNGGVRYEVQRVIDRIPIERVIFLADRRSDHNYLHAEIRHAWSQMADGSPNSGVWPRVARLAVTDSFWQIQQQRSPLRRDVLPVVLLVRTDRTCSPDVTAALLGWISCS
jgi:hypothetical protein